MAKNTLLKVVSIIMIVVAALAILFGILTFVIGDVFADIIQNGSGSGGETDSDGQLGAALLQIFMILFTPVIFICGGLQLSAGILGVRQRRPVACLVLGILVLVICGITTIWLSLAGLFYLLPFIVLPILYLIGAVKYKKACKAAEQSLEG